MGKIKALGLIGVLVAGLLGGITLYRFVLAEENTGTGESSGATPTPTPTPTPNPETICRSYPNCTWYDNSCHCSTSTYTPTPTPTPTPTLTSSTSGSTTDRLAQVGETTLSCIKTILTSSEIDRLRFLQPTTDAEYQELEGLKIRASVCFQSYDQTVKISEGGEKIGYFPDAQRECLIKQVGEVAFNEITSGTRAPTLLEKAKADSCFKDVSGPTVAYQTNDQPLSKDIDNCLVLALGSKRYADAKRSNLNLTLSEREVVNRCFGAGTHPLAKSTAYKIPEKVDSCLVQTLGSSRAKNLETGRLELSESEKKAGKRCFEEINDIQQRLLPVPPKEVPLLQENNSIIKVNSNTSEEVETISGVKDRRFVFAGRGLPKTLVDIFIFSEPIVVSTETDANGDWVYKLSEPLGAGSHVAYAVTKDKSGNSVRSSIYNFEVLAAETVSAEALLDETKATNVAQNFVLYAVALVVALVVVVGLVIFILRKRSGGGGSEPPTSQVSTTSSSSDGQGESETGTGPVN